MIDYKGYTATTSFECGMFQGLVENSGDVIVFYSKTLEGLEDEMKISIDDYEELRDDN